MNACAARTELTNRGNALRSVPTRMPVELSAREREILIAWLMTDSQAAVAKQLYLTTSTVRTYLQRIRDKYARAGRPARTKAALVARAIQDGYVDVDDL